jgi:hypothetical protein
VRWFTGCRDIPAQADEHAAVQPGGDTGRRAVRCPGLCRGAEVEPGTGREVEQPVFLVQADLPPVSGGRDDEAQRSACSLQGGASLWRSLGFEVLATVPQAFCHPADGYVGLHIMYRRL